MASPSLQLRGRQKRFCLSDEVFNLPGKRMHFAASVVQMARRMRQGAAAVVGAVERQIVGAEKIGAVTIDQVISVAVHRQTSPVKGVFLAQRKLQIRVDGNGDVQGSGDESVLYRNGKFHMKVVRECKGVTETKIDGPTAIDEIRAKAALRRHSALAL